MVKHLSENFSLKEFDYLGENTKKYISFSVKLKSTEVKINRKKTQTSKDIKHYIKFINKSIILIKAL